MANEPTTSFIRPEDLWRDLGLRANQTIAHLGSGPGFYLIPAAKLVGSKGQAIGIDVRQDMLEETEGRARRDGVAEIVTTIRADLEAGPVPEIKDHTIDWTLIANILYQSDPTKIITEAARITKSTGTIVIVEWECCATPLGPPTDQRLSRAEVEELVSKAGLTVTKTFAPSPYHYGLLARAK